MQASTAVGAALVLLLGVADRALADRGDGLGIGPVIALSGEYTFVFGWEASAVRGLPIYKASVGGSYDLAPRKHDPHTIHYLAFEPWLLVGATLGFAVADGEQPARFMYGGWEGVPLMLRGGWSSTSAKPNLMLSLTIGIRVFGSTSQLYFAPKLWWYTPLDFGD